MTRAETPLLQLQNADSLSSQAAALRVLKNETIGHDQNKEDWVRFGLIPVLANVLASRGSSRSAELKNGSKLLGLPGSKQEADDSTLQAIIILGSLAQGGAHFLSPILSSNILPILLSILSSSNPSSPFVLPILRILNGVADRLPLQSQQQWPKDTRLADLLFSADHIDCLAHILEQDYKTRGQVASIELAAGLIAKLCTEESHKAVLADCGVLDALAAKVASFIVSQGFVFPGAEQHLEDTGALGELPLPAPRGAKLAPVLRAVTAIIEHSKWRAEHFLSSPGIVTVFPRQIPEFSPSDIKKGPWGSTYLSGTAVPRHLGGTPLEYLLPAVPLSQLKPSVSTTNFPPLGQYAHHRRQSHSYTTPLSSFESPTAEDDENPVVPWLLYLVRAENGMTRLMAARFVTVLCRLGLTRKHRVSMLCYILIPVLLRMLDKDYDASDDGVQYGGMISSTKRIKEEAPGVLATLVVDDQELQKHAVEGDAIKRLSQLLKETYNPIHEPARTMWHAEGRKKSELLESQLSDCRLGPPGHSPLHYHIMRYRENILKALAALVPFKDEYRKAVCEHGVVPYIIDSLKAFPPNPPAEPTNPGNTAADGNPTPTLLAACGAARMLTRSVSVLRTSLIDAGVSTPLLDLIKHPDIEVRIAATSVICNLALDFSPMKEAIISGDVLNLLCEHAHSSNTKLRIESLWALKHVSYNSAIEVKIKIIEGLGPEWIKQVITQDTSSVMAKRAFDDDTDSSTPGGMSRANSAGERVDLLNPMDDAREGDEDMKMTDPTLSSKVSLDMFLPNAHRRRKLALQGDLDQTTRARQDDIAAQEQTLDLLRNVVCGSGAAEMIDHLFKEIGQDLLLDTLADKLRPRSIQLPHRRESPNHRVLQVPNEILVAVLFFIIHLAAGTPWQRELLMTHRDLLRHLMGYFNHSQREVRVSCVWVVINLTYEDDASDRDGCRKRALELKSRGVLERLASLEHDQDLDVRERTKTAQHLVKSLTHS